MRFIFAVAVVTTWLIGTALSAGTARAADAVPATAYFPVLPLNAPPDAAPQLIPVAANHPLDGAHAGITRAVIAIHDATRDANDTEATLATLAGAANAQTLILAPQFLLASDLTNVAAHLPDQGNSFAVWDLNGWPQGETSLAKPGHKGVSSFTALDLLLMFLSDRRTFPDLQTLIVAGFGKGGDMVERYAAFNMAEARLPPDVKLRYLVADAGSFLYLTPVRPAAKVKSADSKAFAPPDAGACPDYDAFPYGLQKLNSYARRVGVNQAKTGTVAHLVTYVNGAGGDAMPDTTCAALLQGADGAARAKSFQVYLTSLYGEAAARTHSFWSSLTIRNNAVGLFGSPCGMAVLFGDGLCSSVFGIH